MMQKIIDYFRKKYFNKKYSPVDLVREQLKGITIDFLQKEEMIESNLSEKQKKGLYAKATLIKKDFDIIANHIINIQGNYAIKEAGNMEQVLFARGTINGIILMKEEIERLDVLYKEQIKIKELFDKHEMI